jgi:hypothetical protein
MEEDETYTKGAEDDAIVRAACNWTWCKGQVIVLVQINKWKFAI